MKKNIPNQDRHDLDPRLQIVPVDHDIRHEKTDRTEKLKQMIEAIQMVIDIERLKED